MCECDIEFSPDVKKTLCIIDKSKCYGFLILLSSIFSIINIDLRKEAFLTSVCDPENIDKVPNTFSLRLITNFSVLIPVLFFYFLARQENEKNTDPKNCSPWLNLSASTAALFATLIRLYQIFYDEKYRLSQTSTESVIEDIEPDDV